MSNENFHRDAALTVATREGLLFVYQFNIKTERCVRSVLRIDGGLAPRNFTEKFCPKIAFWGYLEDGPLEPCAGNSIVPGRVEPA